MTRGMIGSALALVAVALLAACGTAAGGVPTAPPPTTALHLYERDTGQGSVDLGSPGAGPGDLFVFSGDVLDGGPTGPAIGHADGTCTTTSGNPATPGNLVCQVGFALRDGQLETQTVIDSGAFFGGRAANVAITGGTGAYRDARGDGTATIPNVADPSAVQFDLGAGV
jgi:hypothetical protein